MSRNQNEGKSEDFDGARNELFNHIHRCGVIRATGDQQVEWMDETIEYMAECYPSLSREQLGELRTMGLRFCRPVIATAQPQEEAQPQDDRDGSGEASEAAA